MSYRLLVGIDWSTTSHQVCILDPEGVILRELVVEHQAAEIASFVDALVQNAQGQPEHIAVAIERPRGSLVETLMERGLHVYSLNPKQLDRFRDRHTVAGAKDDRLDAYVLADALRNDRHCFRQVEVDHPLVVQIRELSRVHEDLQGEMNRLTNRLRDQIHRSAPHLLKLCRQRLDALLDQLADEHDDDGPSDLEILRSLPGVGLIIAGTLLAEAAPLLRQRDGTTLRAYGGPAPITRRSGKSWVVVMRRGCSDRLRNAFYHWARVSTVADANARAYYAELRARGHTHGRALRSVSDRWIRILMAMLRDRTLYSADHAPARAVQ